MPQFVDIIVAAAPDVAAVRMEYAVRGLSPVWSNDRSDWYLADGALRGYVYRPPDAPDAYRPRVGCVQPVARLRSPESVERGVRRMLAEGDCRLLWGPAKTFYGAYAAFVDDWGGSLWHITTAPQAAVEHGQVVISTGYQLTV